MAGDDASYGKLLYLAVTIHQCVFAHSYMDYRIYMAFVALLDYTIKLLFLYF
jgi:hypothetical protein